MGIDKNEMSGRGLNPGRSSSGIGTPSNEHSLDPDAQNEVIKKWGSMVNKKLAANAAMLFHKGKDGTVTYPSGTEHKLSESIRVKFKKSYGIIDRVSYNFPRHGVFVHKGVGRGYPISGGFVIKSVEGEAKPRTPRKAVEWFNPVIEANLPQLADQLAKINADALINATKILIK